MKIIKFVCLYFLFCSIPISLPIEFAFAEEKSSEKEPFFEEGDEFLFDEIPSVYSASKYEQKVTKAPASISIVTGDEIKKYGYRKFGAILSSLKGFYNTSDRNYGFVGARGFGLPADYNSRLLLLIDGHRYNDNIFDSFYTDEGFPVDVDTIERVEVVRGPSSSLYGTSAVFGVINVITKRGRDQQGANFKSSYGSNDTYKNSFSYGNRFNNGVEAFITGTYYDNAGYNRLYYKEFDPNHPAFDASSAQNTPALRPTLNNGVAVNSDEELARKLMAKLSYGDFSFQGLFVHRRKDVPTASFETLFNSQLQNTTDEAGFFELKYNHTFENQLNLQSRLSYNWYRYKGNLPYADAKKPDINKALEDFDGLQKDLSDGKWWRAEIEATKVFWQDHRITFGGQYQGNFHQFQTNYDIKNPGDPRDSDVSTYQWAIFFQDEYTITNQLTFNAGVRYDYFSIFGSTANPRLGLIYNPFENSTVKLLYGTAFRAPNQFELNYTGSGTLANPGLRPEKLETVELVLEHYFTQQLRAEFNLFHTNITDIISLTSIRNGSIQNIQNQNTGNVDSNGLEIQLEQMFSNGFQGRISYSWQDTKDNATHERLTNSPEHMVKFNLIAPVWLDKLFVGYELQYMSDRSSPPKCPVCKEGHVGDYVISNLTVFSQKWIKGLELSAGAYNLFDEQYFDPGSDTHVQNAIEQNGIQFRIKASMDF